MYECLYITYKLSNIWNPYCEESPRSCEIKKQKKRIYLE